MKMFLTSLIGKRVMTAEGEEMGTMNNIVVETDTGLVSHLLIKPSEAIDTTLFKTTTDGQIVLPSYIIVKITDVIILGLNVKPPMSPVEKEMISKLKHLIEQAERRGIPTEDEKKLLEELERA